MTPTFFTCLSTRYFFRPFFPHPYIIKSSSLVSRCDYIFFFSTTNKIVILVSGFCRTENFPFFCIVACRNAVQTNFALQNERLAYNGGHAGTQSFLFVRLELLELFSCVYLPVYTVTRCQYDYNSVVFKNV